MRKTSFEDVCRVVLERLSTPLSEPFYQSLGSYKFKEYIAEESGNFHVIYAAYHFFENLSKTYSIFVDIERLSGETRVYVSTTTCCVVARVVIYNSRECNKTETEIISCSCEDILKERVLFAMYLFA
jgi:5'(3')-deoxyribonucleotidase